MLRANVKMTPELREAFDSASSKSTRLIIVNIVDEKLVLEQELPIGAGEEADFDGMVPSALADDRPAFALFARDGGSAWIMCLYVPETSNVRAKMMFASSRDDLKQRIGTTYFTGEYQCSDKSEISWAAMTRAGVFGGDGETAAPLTEQEKQEIAERRMSKDRSVASAGMQTVGFKTGILSEALAACATGDRRCVEVIIDPKTEALSVGPAAPDATASQLVDSAHPTEPRFFVLHEGGANGFVYYCPDGAGIRLKMVYSTAKAAVLDACEAAGITFTKKCECRAADELTEVWEAEVKKSARAAQKFSKPKRGARGRTRARKKFAPPGQ